MNWVTLRSNTGCASIVNFYGGGIGNPAVPNKIQQAEKKRAIYLARTRKGRRRRAILLASAAVLLLIGIGLGAWLWQRRAALTSAYKLSTAGIVEKSVAVLPFEYFGGDKDDAYLADGVQDDILTDLAKVADLKVISRRSVAQYRGSTADAREIGKALQIAYVLEGTVRKAGDKLRVTAQLIHLQCQTLTISKTLWDYYKAADPSHLIQLDSKLGQFGKDLAPLSDRHAQWFGRF
jgi:TolB-like protein